jgi:GxxExxY protein
MGCQPDLRSVNPAHPVLTPTPTPPVHRYQSFLQTLHTLFHPMSKLLHQDLTNHIIGVYYDVYNGTGRTYPEFVYERAMMGDLLARKIDCRRQPDYQIMYKGKLVGVQQLDLFVADDVIVEIKVAPALTSIHKAQAISYLKVVNRQVGLLFNFGSDKPDFHRLYFQEIVTPRREIVAQEQEQWPQDLLWPELTDQVIRGLYEVHTILGAGFIHRIYANAVYHELRLRGLAVYPHREYHVYYRGRSVGAIKFNHLQIDNRLMIFPVAIQNLDHISLNNLKSWMKAQNVPLAILANFYPTSLYYTVLYI